MSRKRVAIIEEFDDFVVVDKAPGIPCIPGRSGRKGESLLEHLESLFDNAFTVHRIDINTSGVVVFAKTAGFHRHLSTQFTERSVAKVYLAIVSGAPPQPEGIVDQAIRRTSRGTSVVDSAGKEALTKYRVLESFRGYSFLELRPLTGRTHQIRVHMQAIGCPLCVDPQYGGRQNLGIEHIKSRPNFSVNREGGILLRRTPLHASRIAFRDLEGELLTFESPVPKDIRACLNQLGKWRAIGD